MNIKIDNLQDGQVIALLEEHLADMYATSPAESVHALDISQLKSADITFFSGWNGNGDCLLGCVALKLLSEEVAELKSMRTVATVRKSGVATQLLEYVVQSAKQRGLRKLYLETGSLPFFKPARNLYEKFGFQYCCPFSNYQDDPNSLFMCLLLDDKVI